MSSFLTLTWAEQLASEREMPQNKPKSAIIFFTFNYIGTSHYKQWHDFLYLEDDFIKLGRSDKNKCSDQAEKLSVSVH